MEHSDILSISQLIVQVRIGYEAKERGDPQRIQIDLEMETDFSDVLATENLETGVNYSESRRIIKEIASAQEFVLLENLGDAILGALFKNPKITSAKITIKKLDCWDDAVPGIVMTRSNNKIAQK